MGVNGSTGTERASTSPVLPQQPPTTPTTTTTTQEQQSTRRGASDFTYQLPAQSTEAGQAVLNSAFSATPPVTTQAVATGPTVVQLDALDAATQAMESHSKHFRAYEEMVEYAHSGLTGAGVLATLQATATGLTFGLGVTSGGGVTKNLNDNKGNFHTPNASDYGLLPTSNATESPGLAFTNQAARVGFGGVTGAAGNLFATFAAVPLVSALTQALSRGNYVYQPVPAEHLYPDPNPMTADGRPKAQEALANEWKAVLRGRLEVADLQKGQMQFDNKAAKIAGSAAFGLANAGAAIAQQYPTSPNKLAFLAALPVGLGISAFGGAVTQIARSTRQAYITAPVTALDANGQPLTRPDGERMTIDLNLFRPHKVPSSRAPDNAGRGERMMSHTPFRQLATAAKNFNGGREGWDIVNNLYEQAKARAAGISVALAPSMASAPLAAVARNSTQDPTKRAIITAAQQVFNLSAAVVSWFGTLSALNRELPHAAPQAERQKAIGNLVNGSAVGMQLLTDNVAVIGGLLDDIAEAQASNPQPGDLTPQHEALAKLHAIVTHGVGQMAIVTDSLKLRKASTDQIAQAQLNQRAAEAELAELNRRILMMGLDEHVDLPADVTVTTAH